VLAPKSDKTQRRSSLIEEGRKAQMNNGKIVRNAGSHRILYALSLAEHTSRELKIMVGAINSISRFDGEYMKRLIDNGHVRRTSIGWALTDAGREKVEELGPATGVRPKRTDKVRAVMERPIYTGRRETPMRIGAEEFLKYPSRVGNTLMYRDGRKEKKDD
jgi:hypothetical protein